MTRTVSPRPPDGAVAAADMVMLFVPTALTVVPAGIAPGVVVSLSCSPTRTLAMPPAHATRVEPELTVHDVRLNGADVKENVTVPVGTAPKAEGTTEAVKWTPVLRTGGNGEPARYVFDVDGMMGWLELCEPAEKF